MMAKVKNRKDAAPTSERMSATDTLNLNPAFISRVKKEEATQQFAMAQKLRDDMNRMKDDELFPDMQFLSGGHSVPGHRLIIKSRLRSLTDDNWYEISPGNLPAIHLCKNKPEDAKGFLKALYTSDEVTTQLVMDALKTPDRAKAEGTKPQEAADSSVSRFQGIQNGQIHENNLNTNAALSSQVIVEQIKDVQATQLADNDAQFQPDRNGSIPDHDGETESSADKQVEIADASVTTHIQNDVDSASSLFENHLSETSDHGFECSPAAGSRDAEAGSLPVSEKNEIDESSDSKTAECSSDKMEIESLTNEQHHENNHQASSSHRNSSELEIGSCMVGSKDNESVAEATVNLASASNTHQEALVNKSCSLPEMPSSTDQTNASTSLNQCQPEEHSGQMSEKALESASSLITKHPTENGGGGEEVPAQVTYTPCSSLAEGLLQCYLREDYSDCCLKVDDHKFLAHRCILASRCQYFEAMFAGSWTESDETEIELHGLDARSAKYILLFLYGAMVEVPVADIASVMQAADMLGVEGLKDWTGFLIARDYCHFFHKPCQDCIRMVPDVLVLTSQFNLTSLSERGKRWVATHFRRIWEMQNFGTLPQILLDECTRSVIDHMNIQNITQMILDSHVLVRCLQRNHRAEPVQLAAVKVMDEALAFCAAHFPRLVQSPHFLSWSKDGAWCLDVLEESYTMVVSLLQPEVACEVYSSLKHLLANNESEEELGLATSEEVRRLLKKLVERCEWYLQRYIHRVAQCHQWSLLPADLQQQLLQKCSFVPAQAASSMGAKSRVAQKSAKVLQDNIVHTVTMLCETNPDLFPSLSQTRKILANASKQPPSKSSESKPEATGKDSRKPLAASRKPQKGTPATGTRSGSSESKNSHTSSASSVSRPGSGRSSATHGSRSATSSQASAGPKSSAAVPAARPGSARSQGKDVSASSRSAPRPKAPASSQSSARPSSARGAAAPSVKTSREASAGASGTTLKTGTEAKGRPQSAGTRPSSAQTRVTSSQRSAQALNQKEGTAKVSLAASSARPASARTKAVESPSVRMRDLKSSSARPSSARANATESSSVHTKDPKSSSPSSSRPTSARAKAAESPSLHMKDLKSSSASSSRPASAHTKAAVSPSLHMKNMKSSSASSTGPASARTKTTDSTSHGSRVAASSSARSMSAHTKASGPQSSFSSKFTSTRTKATEHSSHTKVTGSLSAPSVKSRSVYTESTESSSTSSKATARVKSISKSGSKSAVGGATRPPSGPSSARPTKGAVGTSMKTPRPASGTGKDSSSGDTVKTSRPSSGTRKDTSKLPTPRPTPAVRKPVDSKLAETEDRVRVEEALHTPQLSELNHSTNETENKKEESEEAAAIDIKDSEPGLSTAHAGDMAIGATEEIVTEHKSSDPVLPNTEPTPESCQVETTQKTNGSEVLVSDSVIEPEAGETWLAPSSTQQMDAEHDENMATIDTINETVLTGEAEDMLVQISEDKTETEGLVTQDSEDTNEAKRVFAQEVSQDKVEGEGMSASVSGDKTEAQDMSAQISENKPEADDILFQVPKDTTKAEGILAQISEDEMKAESTLAQVSEDKTEAESILTQISEHKTEEESTLVQVSEDKTEEESILTQISEDKTEEQSTLAQISEDKTEEQSTLVQVSEDETEEESTLAQVSEDKTEEQSTLAQISEDKTEEQSTLAQVSEDKTEAESILAQISEDTAQGILAQASENKPEAEDILTEISEEKPVAKATVISEDKTEAETMLAQISKDDTAEDDILSQVSEDDTEACWQAYNDTTVADSVTDTSTVSPQYHEALTLKRENLESIPDIVVVPETPT